MRIVGPNQLPDIITPGGEAESAIAFAAREMQKYLGIITGRIFQIGHQCVPGAFGILLGTRVELCLHGIKSLPAPMPGYDGYGISLQRERLVICGEGARGVLYGTYDFLERCGCRWYYPEFDEKDSEIIPRADTIEMEPFEVSEAGGFLHRVAHVGSMIYTLDVPAALKHIDWAAKARYSTLAFLIAGKGTGVPAQVTPEQMPPPSGAGSGTIYEAMWEYQTSGIVDAIRQRGLLLMGPMHCMVHFLPNDLFSAHPEWFGMKDGERRPQAGPGSPEFCWSNAEAVNAFAENVIGFLRDFPFLDVFAFTPNDGGRPCECNACALWNPCDLYMNIANVVLRKARAAGITAPIEVTAGYPPVEGPPEKILPDPELRVHWAHFGRNHASCYGNASYSYRQNLDGWLALGNEFTMVEYYTGGLVSPSIQPPVCKAIAQDNPWLLQQGVKGNLMLMYPLEQWWNHGLNAWLGICFYYTERSPFDFLEDYCAHYFGPASAPMLEYCTILSNELWLSYFCCGSRWVEPESVDLAAIERTGIFLDRLDLLMADAQALSQDGIFAYRLSRPAHQYRVLSLMGRAAIANHLLSLDVGLASGGGMSPSAVIPRLRDAIRHEEEVVDPGIESLLQRKDGTIAVWMAGRMMHGASKAMHAVLRKLEESGGIKQPMGR